MNLPLGALPLQRPPKTDRVCQGLQGLYGFLRLRCPGTHLYFDFPPPTMPGANVYLFPDLHVPSLMRPYPFFAYGIFTCHVGK